MNRKRVVQLSVPAGLIGIGVALHTGCIPLPIETDVFNGRPRLHKEIGAADSEKPVRVGRTDRVGVESAFGRPDYESTDSTAMVYEYSVSTWQMFFPLCFMSLGMNAEDRFLLLRFGPDGTLASYDVHKSLDALRRKSGMTLREVPKPGATPAGPPPPPGSPTPPEGPRYRTGH